MSSTLRDRLAGKRYGLVLSAGYFGFFGHAGFVEALLHAKLRPAAWAGTSAGGLVASLHAAGMPPPRIAELLTTLERKHFWDPDPLGAAVDALKGGSRATGLLKGELFRKLLADNLPVKRIEQCLEPVLLVGASLSTQSAHVMRDGELASAIHATCAYPGMFQAVRRDGLLLWDGGIIDKAPALLLSEAGLELDALLVHFLPSRGGLEEPAGPLAYLKGVMAGMGTLRKDHFRLQLEVLQARGVEVHVVTSHLPPVSPNALHEGPRALEAGRRSAEEALSRPPEPWQPSD
ncbi:MAG: patatin-like phospholipase family protein [Myxococcaceae bacterium]|nr:patatin-like phospholipase family protein [Myxococcaceae bacterium]